jgi:hypothetical protein
MAILKLEFRVPVALVYQPHPKPVLTIIIQLNYHIFAGSAVA